MTVARLKTYTLNAETEAQVYSVLNERTKSFYEQFSKPLESNRAVFGEPLSAQQSVRQILSEVASDGEQAVKKYSKIFDQFDSDEIKVSSKEFDEAYQDIDPAVVDALNVSIKNVGEYQLRTLPDEMLEKKIGNCYTSAVYQPLERVGIYVPGGTAPLCSSVIMNALPAIVAGVSDVVIFTPPGKNGKINSGILVAADLIGIRDVYKVGGVPAIGMMAYGTKNFKPVYKIAGPGNSFVALAKKEVYGRVDIDLFAGPSEILVIADHLANPKFVAADLIAQAEHDKVACSILITNDPSLPDKVEKEMELQLADLPRKEIADYSLRNFGLCVIVKGELKEAVLLSNKVAPEHLELCVENPEALIPFVKNAGAIFVGNYTPESAGDYLAGPSHTLPTSGTGKFFSGVSAATFIRRTSIMRYEKQDFVKDAKSIEAIAELEELRGHARSAIYRMEEINREK